MFSTDSHGRIDKRNSCEGPQEHPHLAMTVDEVDRRVSRIAALARGEIESPSRDAWAHSEEDALYLDVLRAIATGAANAEVLARAAIKTSEIKFSRWFE
jgi:hypothetical protein